MRSCPSCRGCRKKQDKTRCKACKGRGCNGCKWNGYIVVHETPCWKCNGTGIVNN